MSANQHQLKSNHLNSVQHQLMRRYYQRQSGIYDLTRWSFLFGRKRVVNNLAMVAPNLESILEVGCGTGKNLHILSKLYPTSRLRGVDVSEEMIQIAEYKLSGRKTKIELACHPYGNSELPWEDKPDAILFSYCLTMVNPQWKQLIDQAWDDLKHGGFIAVTDFHDSPLGWFKNHMARNHVKMESHLLPYLSSKFATVGSTIRPAYGGAWTYFDYLGQKLQFNTSKPE